MTTETKAKQNGNEICTLTIVRGGASDRKLKVYPAQHSEEKIWLDTREGAERWQAIERVLNLHAPRTGVVPKPVPMCGNDKDLRTITLRDEDIPVVNLEGYTLEKPPEEVREVLPPDTEEVTTTAAGIGARVAKIEHAIGLLTEVVLKMVPASVPEQPVQEPVVRRPGRPKGS